MALNIDNLIERVELTHKKYLEEKTRFKTETELVNKERDELKKSLEELQSSYNDANSKNEALNDDFNKLKDEYDSLKEVLSDKENIISDLNSSAQKYETDITSLKNEIIELKDSLKAKEEELTNTPSKDSIKEILNNDSAVYKELLNKYEDLQVTSENNIASLKDDLLSKSEEYDELLNSVSAEKEKYLSLKEKTYKTIKHLVEDVIEKQEIALAKLEAEKLELNNKIKLQEVSITGLTKDNVELKRELDILKEKLDATKKEEVAVKEVKRTSLDDFIDSTIPVPKDTAAANLRPIKRVSEITENTIPYNFGRTSKEIMDKVLLLIDELFNNVTLNNNNEYPLNNPLLSADRIDMDRVTLNTVMSRLTAMTYNNVPLLVYKGNMYYATIDKDIIKNYISEN